MWDKKERQLESGLSATSEPTVSVTDFWAFKKEMQEEIKVIKASNELKEKFANERLVWLGLLVATWAGLAAYVLSKVL